MKVWDFLLQNNIKKPALYQKNCALFDKSIKFGTHVDYNQRNIFGYESAHKCTYGDHSNGFLKWQP